MPEETEQDLQDRVPEQEEVWEEEFTQEEAAEWAEVPGRAEWEDRVPVWRLLCMPELWRKVPHQQGVPCSQTECQNVVLL